MEQIFVYGTFRPLRPDTSPDDSRFYPQIATYVQSSIPAHLLKGVLYDFGDYPRAVPGEGIVYGDLLTVKPAALTVTDRIEGHPTFFHRARVLVHTEAGSTKAWIYWVSKVLIIGKPRIIGGDWFRRGER